MTDAQLLSIDSMRTFVQREIAPVATARRYGAASREDLLELTQAVAEFGLPGMAVPKALGGHGVDWVTYGRLFEELAMGSVELAGQVLLNTLAANLLMQQPSLCGRYLPDLIAGHTLAGITLNGPTSALHGRRKGDAWVIDGRCDHVAASLHADLLITAVRESGQASSWMLLDCSEDRYELRHYHDVEGEKHRCLQITQAKLPATRWLGDAGPDSVMTRQLFDVFKLHEAVIQLARGQALLDASIARARNNTQFGRPIAAQHFVATQFADLATQLDAARLMCGQGFQLLEAGRLDANVARRARLLTTETAQRIERRVSRIDSSHVQQDVGGWPYSNGPLSLLSESIALDAQRIADELIGDLP
jgi:alkylation response protein AidB-like acyl-CoA dehydrogenase